MLRNEVRYTTSSQRGVPGALNLDTGAVGPPSLFGAGEYAKDGLITVTEYLGRTAWYARMVDMVADAMAVAPVDSRFGKLPASDSELNGDYLQVLPRLALMTGDDRFLEWGRRIADAYIDEVLPGSHGVPSGQWNFTTHTGDGTLRLRDHGNELVVGLVLQYALEHYRQTPRAAKWRPVIARMLDRILASANPDGLLYNVVDTADARAAERPAVGQLGLRLRRGLHLLPVHGGDPLQRRGRGASSATCRSTATTPWEPRNIPELPLGSFDGYADTIESAIYLVSREPVPEALDVDRIRDGRAARHAAARRPLRVPGTARATSTARPCSTRSCRAAACGRLSGSRASASARSPTAGAFAFT